MMNLIIIALVKNEIDNTCRQLGLPVNEQVSMELAKCLVQVLADPNSADSAIEDLFNGLGLTEWRGSAMANAFMQTIKGLPTASDPMSYLSESFDNLTGLRDILSAFERADNSEADEDYDDEEDGHDEPEPQPQIPNLGGLESLLSGLGSISGLSGLLG